MCERLLAVRSETARVPDPFVLLAQIEAQGNIRETQHDTADATDAADDDGIGKVKSTFKAAASSIKQIKRIT